MHHICHFLADKLDDDDDDDDDDSDDEDEFGRSKVT